MMHVRFNEAWHGKVQQTTLQIKWSSIRNELHIDKTPHDLFGSLPFMYPTRLNVVSMARGWSIIKLSNLGKFKWGRKQRTTIPETPHEHIIDLVLFWSKHNFRVVKHARWCHHVKLGKILPHLHIKFIKFGVTVI